MIDSIKTLINKTNELEDKLNNLSQTQTISSASSGFASFSKNNISLSFSNLDNFLIAEFEVVASKHLYFQNQIELNLPISQNVKISLIVNDIAIYKTTRKVQEGFNQLSIMKSYVPLKSEQVKVYLKIVAEDGTPITIISNNLFVWGLYEKPIQLEYQVIETNDKYLLSYIENNGIYYKFVDKEEDSLNSEDFQYYGSATSYSFVFNKNADELFLFRIDLDGNLFFTEFYENNETYVTSNASHVATATDNNLTVVSYIKNNSCYTFEFDLNRNISNESMVFCYNFEIVKSYIYFNQYNNKFYLILTDANNSNYLTQSVLETKTEHKFINATYSISITTYEGDL